jgi:hypothetical protein
VSSWYQRKYRYMLTMLERNIYQSRTQWRVLCMSSGVY